MPIKTTDYDGMRQHLVDLGLKPGDDLFVQTRLFAFGHLTMGIEDIYRAIRSLIGEDATIVVPTHRYTADPDEPFDPMSTPSESAGLFEMVVGG